MNQLDFRQRAILVLAAIALAAGSSIAATAWTFDLGKTTVHEAWVGDETIYLRCPSTNEQLDDDIPASPGLPLLTYRNDQGYPESAAIAAIDVKSGKWRWTRGYAGDYLFVPDPRGKDLWAMTATFDRLDAMTGKTVESVPFSPKPDSAEAKVKDSYRTINGLRIGGDIGWGGTRFGRRVNDPVQVYDIDTKEIISAMAISAKSPNKLRLFDLAIDQSPTLVQTHVQMRPIGGGNALWRFSTGGYSTNRPVLFGSDVLALSGMPNTVGQVTLLNGETGEPRWITRLPRGAYSINQTQFDDGWYGVESWSAVGKLDEEHLFAVGGDGTIHVLSVKDGSIVGNIKTDSVLLAAPRLIDGSLVIVGGRRIDSVPFDVILQHGDLDAVKLDVAAARALLKQERAPEAVPLAQKAADASPLSEAAWRTLFDASVAAKQTDGAVRAGSRILELTRETTLPYLREQLGLLARIPTGPLRVSVVDLGLFFYAPSTDGLMYVIDPTSMTVSETTSMQGDAGWVRLFGNQMVRKGDDRRLEVLVSSSSSTPPPQRDDPLFGSEDDNPLKVSTRKQPDVPREWTTEGGPYGPVVKINERRVRTLQGGGVRELRDNQVVDHPSIIDGVDRWHLIRTRHGPLGAGEGGLYSLDDDFRPAKFLVDLRDRVTVYGMPVVLTADLDDTTLAVIHSLPGTFPHLLKMSLHSADGKRTIRSEEILPPGPFDDLEREGARLFKLNDGYFYAGGELAWIPIDPAKPIWRFRANAGPESVRASRRDETLDRSFGIPRIRDGKLFVSCRYGGVFVFNVADITSP